MSEFKPEWRKSSFSQGAGECVEYALKPDGGVLLRDSKDPDGTIQVFSAESWRQFLAGVKAGQAEPLASTFAPGSVATEVEEPHV